MTDHRNVVRESFFRDIGDVMLVRNLFRLIRVIKRTNSRPIWTPTCEDIDHNAKITSFTLPKKKSSYFAKIKFLKKGGAKGAPLSYSRPQHRNARFSCFSWSDSLIYEFYTTLPPLFSYSKSSWFSLQVFYLSFFVKMHSLRCRDPFPKNE